MRITISQALMAWRVFRMVWNARRGNAERIHADATRVMLDEMTHRHNDELMQRRETFNRKNDELKTGTGK